MVLWQILLSFSGKCYTYVLNEYLFIIGRYQVTDVLQREKITKTIEKKNLLSRIYHWKLLFSTHLITMISYTLILITDSAFYILVP